MQLYSVTLQQLHMVSRFDGKGALIERSETLVAHTMRDLPWQTAKMYQDTSEPGRCLIEKQAQTVANVSERRGDRVNFNRNASSSASPAPTPKPSKADRIAAAARSGNLAAAINE